MAFDPTKTTQTASEIERLLKHLEKKCYSETESFDYTKESIYYEFKNNLISKNIDDESLKLVGLAFSFDEGSSHLESGLSSYSAYMASKIFDRKKRKDQSNPRIIRFIHFDKDKLKQLNGENLEQYVYECLKSTGMSENLLDSAVANFENLNTNLGLNLSEGGTLRQAMTECAKKSKAHILAQERSQSRHHILSPELTDLINKYDEEAERQPVKDEQLKTENEEITEYGNDKNSINFFVGYDKEKVAALFIGKENVLESFNEFVDKFNNLMNMLTVGELSAKQCQDLANDIDPEFLKMQSLCAQHGADGALIQNLCDGMMEVLQQTAKAKEDGKNLNAIELKKDLASAKTFDYSDNDGLRNNARTEEDIRECAEYGVVGVLTNSEMEQFRQSAEYNLLQEVQTMALGRSDISIP